MDEGESPLLTREDVEVIREALFRRGHSFEQIPPSHELIDFSQIAFPTRTNFEGFVFGGRVTFEGARFDGPTHNFRGAAFLEDGTFESAEFCGDFDGVAIRSVGSLRFNGAKFHGNASFDGSRFQGLAVFEGTRFLGTATFEHCRFTAAANFLDTEFQSLVSFIQAHFQTAAFFQRATFNGSVPAFLEANLSEYTEWHVATWPKTPKNIDQALDHIQAYQRLARMMNGLEKSDDQRMFIRREMRVRRQVDDWFPVGIMNHAYELVCDYGFGLGRILAIWAGHIAGGAALLFVPKLIDTLQDGAESGWQDAQASILDFLLVLVLSFTNAHGPLGLYRTFFQETLQDWPWLIWIGPVQTVLGVIILFFLLLTIRNRFRMR